MQASAPRTPPHTPHTPHQLRSRSVAPYLRGLGEQCPTEVFTAPAPSLQAGSPSGLERFPTRGFERRPTEGLSGLPPRSARGVPLRSSRLPPQVLSRQVEDPPTVLSSVPTVVFTAPAPGLESPDGGSPNGLEQSPRTEVLSHQMEDPPTVLSSVPTVVFTAPAPGLESSDGGSPNGLEQSPRTEVFTAPAPGIESLDGGSPNGLEQCPTEVALKLELRTRQRGLVVWSGDDLARDSSSAVRMRRLQVVGQGRGVKTLLKLMKDGEDSRIQSNGEEMVGEGKKEAESKEWLTLQI
ncbi:hypothetical protein B0H17DRAFT_1139631 [Mycena rosella]|uniref:Uncharacterized protein n=1 Tax=Mycena rosella TaxID=1033263 RepID=A0AAD7D3Q8_MYCRO|nr:hypothetical protein B0H17DRAFT_1139631 [Mycena rosella]